MIVLFNLYTFIQRIRTIEDVGLSAWISRFVDNSLSDPFSRKRYIDNSKHSLSSKLPKRVCVSDSIVKCIPNAQPEITGKHAKMKFVDEKEQEQWYEKIISSYNVITGKYSVYFLYE